MKYIVIPADVSIEPGSWAQCPTCNQAISSDDTIVVKYGPYADSVIHDKKNSPNHKQLGIVLDIAKRFRGAKAGDVVALENAEWEILEKAAKDPTNGFNSRIMEYCESFLDSILKAPSEDPREDKKVE